MSPATDWTSSPESGAGGEIGTYLLALWLEAPQQVSIGRLGCFEFPAGWYLYVGSARGPGGLAARLARHQRRLGIQKRPHWHVDFLREWATWGGAWRRTGAERLECAWAASICRLPDAAVVAPGFGASDCYCPAHLIHLPTLPEDEWFIQVLEAKRLE